MKIDRVFLIVLDSAGIGELPDASDYNDTGSNTFKALFDTGKLQIPTMAKMGFYNIDGCDYAPSIKNTIGSYARLTEKSKGKDTTIGHWEIAGIVSPNPLPTYLNGFPEEIIDEFCRRTGYDILCNKPYSGTQVLTDYASLQKESILQGGRQKLIVYTSADSVFQIAANEDWIPLNELYRCCEIAREMLTEEHGVGRVIARPFKGEHPTYYRTANRHDYSIAPPSSTMCDILLKEGFDTIGIGKIYDIFAGSGISKAIRTKNNTEGMEQTEKLLSEDFRGLAFINLVDFDMLYGHRNNACGYTEAMNQFDLWLADFISNMRSNDLLMITADHGCDPSTPSTDHSREYVPLLIYGNEIQKGINYGTRESFSDIAATVLDVFGISNNDISGESMCLLI